MNVDEALGVLEAVMDLWPNEQAWSDRTGEAWLAQLTHYDVADVRAALVELHGKRARRPAWSDVAEQLRAIARAHVAHQPALPAAPPDFEKQVTRAGGVKRARQRGVLEHRGHTKEGAGSCWCSVHDHTNTAPFGYSVTFVRTKDREGNEVRREHYDPVPGYFFDCPHPSCGDPMLAQHYCSTWTKAGIEFMRSRNLRATTTASAVEMDRRDGQEF